MPVKFVKDKDRKFQQIGGESGDIQVGRDAYTDVSKTMSCGVVTFENCNMEWTVLYDEYLYCLEGTFTIETKEGNFVLEPGDGIWLPENTWMIYKAKKKAKAVIALYPIDWRKRHGME